MREIVISKYCYAPSMLLGKEPWYSHQYSDRPGLGVVMTTLGSVTRAECNYLLGRPKPAGLTKLMREEARRARRVL